MSMIFGFAAQNSLADESRTLSSADEQNNPHQYQESYLYTGYNFVAPSRQSQSLKDMLEDYAKNYLALNNESLNQTSVDSVINVDKNQNGFNINFDNNIIGVTSGQNRFTPNGNSSNNDNSSGSSSSQLVIDDIAYAAANTAESSTWDGETIFVTDGTTNQLISCTQSNGKYTCHTAVSNLNNPQDILVINNFIYIINSNKQLHANGDITKCNINSSGYIYSCSPFALNIQNPVWFHYTPPTISISGFVYSGMTTPTQAINCSIDYSSGNLFNCLSDPSTISMAYISKYYNNAYYRPYSDKLPPAIQKCATQDATICTPMTNSLLVYPLSVSINQNRIFISNETYNNTTPASILKCSMDLQTCSILTQAITSPMGIAVYNFSPAS